MKHLYIMAILLSINIAAKSQSFTPVVINNAGGSYSNASLTFEWSIGENVIQTISNGQLITTGVLQPYTTNFTLPVIDLQFFAKRISNTMVQLDWKTSQEINNKGFYIERKKENENNFVQLGIVKSNANGGNSSSPLQYQYTDNNIFTGSTYYRLKQEDIDGRTTYSVVRMVKGDAGKQLTMQVWPVPAVGFFNVTVNGLDKTDLILVVDMNGRLVKQFNVQNQTQQQVSGLPAGTYFIKLGSDKTVGQKVILQ